MKTKIKKCLECQTKINWRISLCDDCFEKRLNEKVREEK